MIDWKRLGARFGVADVCVEFDGPTTVHAVPRVRLVPAPRGGERRRVRLDGGAPVAERAIAAREGPEGVWVLVECGLVLHLKGARLAAVDPGSRAARVFTAAPTRKPFEVVP